MKRRYKALIEDRYVIESVVKFDEDQAADLERLLQEFGNITLKLAKENPELVNEMDLPEPRTVALK